MFLKYSKVKQNIPPVLFACPVQSSPESDYWCGRNWHLLQWVLPPLKYKDKTRRALASKERYNMEKQEAKSHLQMVLNTIGFADWLVIYMVARNIDRWRDERIPTN